MSGAREGFGYIHEYPEILFEGMSEEHGHLNIAASVHPLRIGDRLSILPNHVCACVNMHDRIFYHRKGVVEGVWPIAGRGRVI